MHPDECILVVCPLLALMDDQVQSAITFGIKVVQLSASTIRNDPNLLERVRLAEYSMVLVSAEFTSSEAWKSLVREDRAGRTSSFSQSLRRIIIDEAHLVREWSVCTCSIASQPMSLFHLCRAEKYAGWLRRIRAALARASLRITDVDHCRTCGLRVEEMLGRGSRRRIM
jgi:hypothetical protein